MLNPAGFTRYLMAAALIPLALACSGPSDPFTSGPAAALVGGTVTGPTGVLVGESVRIACVGAAAVVATTDSTGQYLASPTMDDPPFSGYSGQVRCQLMAPEPGPRRVEFDTTLGFARGPVFLAHQTVDLHEP